MTSTVFFRFGVWAYLGICLMFIYWLLVSEPGKTGADVNFGHFRTEMRAFEEIKPENKNFRPRSRWWWQCGGEKNGNMS